MAMWKLRLCLRRRKISSWRLKNNNLKRECVFNLPTRSIGMVPGGRIVIFVIFLFCAIYVAMPSL